jgi:hypothetical protein
MSALARLVVVTALNVGVMLAAYEGRFLVSAGLLQLATAALFARRRR